MERNLVTSNGNTFPMHDYDEYASLSTGESENAVHSPRFGSRVQKGSHRPIRNHRDGMVQKMGQVSRIMREASRLAEVHKRVPESVRGILLYHRLSADGNCPIPPRMPLLD